MIYLEDLLKAKEENEQAIKELENENRVFDKLINIEKSKQVEVSYEETQEIIEENEQGIC